jgi:Tfp pilus tip-associated adhesin PilY1
MSSLKSLSLAVLVTIIPQLAHAATSFVPNDQPRGWVTQPALSSYVLRTGGIYYRFVGSYDLGTWSGDIYADEIDSIGDFVEPYWSATTVVGMQDYDTGRKIVTLKSDGTKIAFRWASLSSSQQTSIGDATNGPKILNFIRGDRSNEDPNGSKFRKRDSVIGPVVHSSLIHWQHDSSTRRVYSGANDGMLHILDADTGAEQFAYIPSMLIGNLKNISTNPYTTKDYFVDGGFSISNATLSSTLKTLLVGGLGAGGKGLFALDITTPTAADEADAATKIKWEITPSISGFENLGYTYGTPKIARLNNGTPVAIAGNGYVNGGNGHATLLIIDLDNGTLVKEIDTGSGNTGSPNGLSSPTLRDTNGDGKVDYVYAGDLDGHLWKFDLSSSDPATYTATNLYTTSPAQAITVQPVIQLHPNGGHLVMFATGRTLTSSDITDNSVHYVYGIWDGAPVINKIGRAHV